MQRKLDGGDDGGGRGRGRGGGSSRNRRGLNDTCADDIRDATAVQLKLESKPLSPSSLEQQHQRQPQAMSP